MTTHTFSYQILDVSVLLETSSEAFQELFEMDYGLFKNPSTDQKKLLTVSLHLDNKRGSPRLSIDNKNIALAGHPAPIIYAYQMVLRSIFESIQDFMVLHGGVVAKDNHALILAGFPGMGKTTLALELLRNGFSFFSDDFCPIHKKSRLVYPFPRCAWKSIPSGQSGLKELDKPGGCLRGTKIPIRPNELGAILGEEPCRAKCLICLVAGDDSEEWCELEIGLKKEGGDELISDVRQLQGVIVEELNRDFCSWSIKYHVSQCLTREIRQLLKKHEHHTWYAFRHNRIHPDFTREPVLSPIAPSEAAFHLLPDLKVGSLFATEEEACLESPMRVFLGLCELLEGVSCYRLRVGKLQSMRDLILQLAC